MIIYLEGPDGSGKSTLVNNIDPALTEMVEFCKSDAKVLVPTHPKDEQRLNEKELFRRLKELAKSKYLYIIDRCMISDLVYRVFDDYQPVTTLPKIINFMKKYNKYIFTIYCRTKTAEVDMNKRGDDNPIAKQKHKEITKVFDLVMQDIVANLPHNYFVYDWHKKRSINELLGQLNYFVYMNTED